MDLADILGREQIVPELKATNRWEAIDELIGNLVATGKIQPADREAIVRAAVGLAVLGPSGVSTSRVAPMIGSPVVKRSR